MTIQKLFVTNDEKISNLGRSRASVATVFSVFKQKPLLSISELTRRTGLSKPTAISAVTRLIDLGIIENVSEKKWGQIYAYTGYTSLLAP